MECQTPKVLDYFKYILLFEYIRVPEIHNTHIHCEIMCFTVEHGIQTSNADKSEIKCHR